MILFTTFAPTQADFSFYRYKVKPRLTVAIAQPKYKQIEAEAETWDTHLSSLREAIFEAKAAKRKAKINYEKVQALAESWEMQLQLALKKSGEEQVRKALFYQRACADKARELRATIEQHSVQISILKTQLADWKNQLAV